MTQGYPRFAIPSGTITCKINSWPTKAAMRPLLSQSQVELSISAAFTKWYNVSNFNFKKVDAD